MLYIIRHGQTAKNKEKLLQGRSDMPLNDEGREQAARTGRKLAEHGVSAGRIYSSPLIRAVETAEIIGRYSSDCSVADGAADRAANGADDKPAGSPICDAPICDEGGNVSVRTDERLIEMDYGPYEGMDLSKPAPEVMAFFMDFAGTPAPEGMEQLSSVVARAGDFLEEIRDEAQEHDIIIATHAIAMKGLLEYLTPDSNGSYWSEYIGNCDVYAAEVMEDGYGIPYPFITGDRTPGV